MVGSILSTYKEYCVAGTCLGVYAASDEAEIEEDLLLILKVAPELKWDLGILTNSVFYPVEPATFLGLRTL